MPKKQAVFNDFRGGLNVDSAIDHIKTNELVTAINVDYSERGSVRKRCGVEKLNEESYFGNVTQIFEWNRADGTVQLFAVIDKTLYEVDDLGNRTTLIVLNSNRIDYYYLQNVMYFTDGDKYRSYDGEQIKEIVVNEVTLSSTPTYDDTGAEPGTYKIAVTFVNTSGQEAVASKISSITITENSLVLIENIPLPVSDTKYRSLYAYRESKRHEEGSNQWNLIFSTVDPSVVHFNWDGRVVQRYNWVTR